MTTLTTRQARERRHRRVRGKVVGTAERPRLSVFRSNRGIFAQLVDDASGRTLAAADWLTVSPKVFIILPKSSAAFFLSTLPFSAIFSPPAGFFIPAIFPT